MSTLYLPDRKVPKKYRKYAEKKPSLQLYRVRPRQMGVILMCCDCHRDIPADEEFMQLLFREPGTQWTNKAWLALCMNCAKKS